jgi:hypothetical protein
MTEETLEQELETLEEALPEEEEEENENDYLETLSEE